MWKIVDDQLYKKFTFDDFSDAVAFINQVATVAEELNHHPRLQNVYNTVEIWLSTHDAGDKVTVKDKDLAHKIDALLEAPKSVAKGSNKKIKLYGDGGSRGNPGPSASGYVLLDMEDNVIKKAGVYLGITTNNQAEYQSLKFGLQDALSLGVEEVDVYMDSQLVIRQLTGQYKMKNADLRPHYEAILDLAKQFKHVNFAHVPRELNKLADAEVNTTLDAEATRG
jgi:ribonuclease HI